MPSVTAEAKRRKRLLEEWQRERVAAEQAPMARIDVYRKGETPPTWPGKRPQDTYLVIEVPA